MDDKSIHKYDRINLEGYVYGTYVRRNDVEM